MSSISPVNNTQVSSALSVEKSSTSQAFKATLDAAITNKTTISHAARDIHSAEFNSAATSKSEATAIFETDQGSKNLNIDSYFAPSANASGSMFTLPPLLLPNQKNIDALSSHISAIFPQFLAQNNIPSAPSSITYDSAGKIKLPPDYPYASEFKQALANNPAMARELSTVSALTSHLVEMKKVAPFQQEYSAAVTQAEIDAIVAKYSHLLSSNHHYDTIALHFSANGSLKLTADGKPVS